MRMKTNGAESQAGGGKRPDDATTAFRGEDSVAARAQGNRHPLRSRMLTALSVVLCLAGAVALLYPAAANWLASRNHAEVIQSYDDAADRMTQEQIDAEWQRAVEYNESLIGQPVHDPFVPGSGYAIPDDYDDVLNIDGDGVIGSLTIPKIGLDLPIYHGVSDESLTRGVGHIPSTTLPIGGPSTHSVLTGHRGLPSAELFTRLDELHPGDVFVIDVLGRKLAYRVYGIDTVLPNELDSLAVQQGRDLVTLVTCTPYGVNTHRLLVHAERTDYDPSMNNSVEQGFRPSTDMMMRLAGAALGLALLAVALGAAKGVKKVLSRIRG